MIRFNYFIYFALIYFFVSPLLAQENFGTIIIELDTLENQNGSIQISLYSDEKGFPDEYEEAFLYKTIPITPELERMILENIPHGTYALSILLIIKMNY